MGAPTFTVVIPTHNRAEHIERAVRSVLAQELPPLEVIVVDDGSTDRTREVVDGIAGPIVYIYQENAERAVARNTGATSARGTHLAFIDDDDDLLPHHFRVLAAVLDERTPVAYTRAAYRLEDGSIFTPRKRYPEGWVTRELLRGNFVALHCAVVRTDVFREVGGFCTDRRVIGSEDWELWTRLSVRYPFTHAPETTAMINVHSERTSYDVSVLERCAPAALSTLVANPLTHATLSRYEREAWFHCYLFVALACYRADEPAKARRYLGRAVRAWPRGLTDLRVSATFLKSFIGRPVVEWARRALGLRRI